MPATLIRAGVPTLCLLMLAAGPAAAQHLTGDELSTNEGPLVIHPINHATFAMAWDGTEDIDVAVVCFNLPYTMTEEQAESAVRDFAPKVVYPYHYRGSDVEKFKRLVGRDEGVDVRTGDWY